MSNILFEAPNGVTRKFADMGDGTHAEVVTLGAPAGGSKSAVASAESVIATDGTVLLLGSLPTELGYAAGVLSTITVTHPSGQYRQTLTYANGLLSSVSTWVKQ